ncbi:MAG: hypothetical protein H7276_17665 [Caulobacter sp.]|nr:hypothetical protein [Vitreoscilla sp.]
MGSDVEQLVRAGWQMRHMDNGAGFAAIKGTEVHFRATDARRAIQRNASRTFVGQMLDEFGMLTTRAEVADEANQRFIRRMGFTETWTDGIFKFYLLTALPFERKQPCQC